MIIFLFVKWSKIFHFLPHCLMQDRHTLSISAVITRKIFFRHVVLVEVLHFHTCRMKLHLRTKQLLPSFYPKINTRLFLGYFFGVSTLEIKLFHFLICQQKKTPTVSASLVLHSAPCPTLKFQPVQKLRLILCN